MDPCRGAWQGLVQPLPCQGKLVWQPSLLLQLGSCPAHNTKVEYQETNWIALAGTRLVSLKEDLSLEIIS